MAEDENPAQPRSLILLAGPVDARINPGPVNRYAAQTPAAIERRAIMTVRDPTAAPVDGSTRASCRSPASWAWTPAATSPRSRGCSATSRRANDADAARTKAFYEEYFAVLDIAAEFYLDTARAVFMDHDLARGRLGGVTGRSIPPRSSRAPC